MVSPVVGGKLNVKKTFILGLGFFAVSLVWPLYNVYVPIFLRDFLDSQFQINGIMTLDNILAVTLIPVVAAMSDRTKSRFGRRMPYLMVGIPLSAVAFLLLPNYWSFWSLIAIITLLNFSMTIFRAPTVALMPDITPPPLRSKANGIINFMGGLASVFVLVGGSFLYRLSPHLPFILTALLMVLALLMLLKFIKEPTQSERLEAEEDAPGFFKSLKNLMSKEAETTRWILFAIFFWFVGYQGVEATFSTYCVKVLGLAASDASLILGFFALAFLICAIPAGFVGSRLGKKKTIMIGIAGDFVVFIALAFIGTLFPYHQGIMMALMAIGGLFWALININSYPMVVEMADPSHVGTYTGLYYFASSLAAILGPLVVGAVVDIAGFWVTFPLTALAYALAGFCIRGTKTQKNL